MKRKPPAKRPHAATEGPYDRFAVYMDASHWAQLGWRVVRINDRGWIDPSDVSTARHAYAGNERSYRTKEEALRLLALYALRGWTIAGAAP